MRVEQSLSEWFRNAVKCQPDLADEWLEDISQGKRVKRFCYNRGFIMTAELYITPPILDPSPFVPLSHLFYSLCFLLLSPLSSFYLIETVISNLSGGNDITDEIQDLLEKHSVSLKKEQLNEKF